METETKTETPEERQERLAAEERAKLVYEYVKGLRDLSDFIEDHPDLLDRSTLRYTGVHVFELVSGDELPKRLRMLGSFDKVADDYYLGGKRMFGPHQLRVTTSREETCKKVPTGESVKETRQKHGDQPIPEGAVNVRTRTVEIVEYDVLEPVEKWECPPSLLALDQNEETDATAEG